MMYYKTKRGTLVKVKHSNSWRTAFRLDDVRLLQDAVALMSGDCAISEDTRVRLYHLLDRLDAAVEKLEADLEKI